MPPLVPFLLSLGVLMLAGREIAIAGRALGLPGGIVALLESLALR
jgi:hypothetical protein